MVLSGLENFWKCIVTGISKENCIPIFLDPTPPIKCKTHQIWPTLSWKSYFFIIFFYFFVLKKKSCLWSNFWLKTPKIPFSGIIFTSACPNPIPDFGGKCISSSWRCIFIIYIWIGNASQAFCPHEWPLATEIFHSQFPRLSKMHLGTRILMSEMHQCSLIQTAKMHHAKIFTW